MFVQALGHFRGFMPDTKAEASQSSQSLKMSFRK